jgi:catechol 2,3-dioxygenase-like lactoylglutathione lyase family enzyme
MKQSLALVSVVVRDYDEAITFYIDVLGFQLVEDRYLPEQDKRWVVLAPAGAVVPADAVAPVGDVGARLLLARAADDAQSSRIGNQTGGRVFLFLYTDNFWRDYHAYREKGVEFVREPRQEEYGTVAVFRDLYGNLWDLLQPHDIEEIDRGAAHHSLS